MSVEYAIIGRLAREDETSIYTTHIGIVSKADEAWDRVQTWRTFHLGNDRLLDWWVEETPRRAT
jgi:hypothetical protein